jgi:thioredoxin 1
MALARESHPIRAGQRPPRILPIIITPSSSDNVETIVSDNIIHVTDAEFDEKVLKSRQPVLTDFWAEWCGPCKMIAPILEDIAKEYAGRLTVAKINIDDNPSAPQRYGVRGIPTLILFKDGQAEATKVGALAKSQLAAFIDANL